MAKHHRRAVLSAATFFVAALGLSGWLSGCSSHTPPATAPASPTSATTVDAAPPAAPLPDPAALTDVLYRLADINVPGADKVGLVEQGTADDAAAIDRFGRALADGGFLPLTLEASDLKWSPTDPGNVVATVTAKPTDPQAGAFTFPMEFTQFQGSWQLTRHTADLLLERGESAAPTPTG